jgi:hypothetical protein
MKKQNIKQNGKQIKARHDEVSSPLISDRLLIFNIYLFFLTLSTQNYHRIRIVG